MTITRNFKLCLNAGTQNAPYINANQYDEGEEWVFDLYTEGGQKFTPSTGAIIGIKSDGHAILNSGTVNSDGQVVITETQQMTAASGLAVFELLIEGETHGTANFIVNVERRPSDDAEFSDSDLSMLQEAIDAAEVINEILDEGGDPSEIIEENVNAWLDNHPEATTTVEDGAITAPKINNSLWDKLLVSESASGAVASFDDGADDVPVSSLKVTLEPVQLGSGDPSPSNIRPIIASNGKNLLNDSIKTLSGHSIFFAGATGETDTTHFFTLPVGTYTFSVEKADGTGTNIYLRNVATQASVSGFPAYGVKEKTFTLAETTNCIAWVYESTITATTDVKTAMIRPASITDSSYQPYQGIMVERCGKNLFDKDNVNLMNAYINGSGTILRSTPDRMVYAHVKPNTDYSVTFTQKALTGSAYADDCQIGFYATKPELNATGTRVYSQARPSATVDYVYTFMGNSGNNSWIAIKIGNAERTDIISTLATLQIEEGSATTYVPYIGASYPYTLGQSVYGGTVDLATGVLTVDKGIITKAWSEFTSQSSHDTYKEGRITGLPVDTANRATTICDKLKYDTNSNDSSFYISGANYIRAFVPIDLADTTEFTFVYPLATPTIINLTPTEVKTLLGYNNISSSGTVDVIYHADTKLYIDKKIGELS